MVFCSQYKIVIITTTCNQLCIILAKPFTADELGEKVREVLDNVIE